MQVRFLFGVTPRIKYTSTASSTQALPRPWPVWPSASNEMSLEEVKILLRPTAQSYGVAGSRVVPMTMIGAVLIEVILFVVRVSLSLVGGVKYLQAIFV